MAQRVFKLPGVDKLTKDQELARNLQLEGQHLIIGGPGTGKSVVALLRVKQLADENKNYIFLVFNRLLKHSCFLLADQKLVSEQWQAWFLKLFTGLFKGVDIPRLPLEPKQTLADFDWDRILEMIHSIELSEPLTELPYIVIDEGQDMPLGFYQALSALNYENFYVVADQNQQIMVGQNSSRTDLEDVLAIDSDDVIELKTNHRNNYNTAFLARQFYTGDPSSPLPELPNKLTHNVLKPLLFNYQAEQFNRICNKILLIAKSYPSKLVAIITPNNNIRFRFFNELNKQLSFLERTAPLVSTYQHGDAENIPFDQGGIMVINAQACKGLEFDYVFIADIDKYQPHDIEHTKKLFYVMTSRATERVFLLSEREKDYPVYPIIPKDAEILEIK